MNKNVKRKAKTFIKKKASRARLFDAEKMKYFKNVFVKLDRDFTTRKRTHPSEWKDFSSVVRLCAANGFVLTCYIKYSFLNRLVTKSRGKVLSDVSFLSNTPQILAYAREKDEIERLYKIYRSIQKTILLVRKASKESGCTAKEALRKIVGSAKLSTYVSTGVVSPYFVALIPKAAVLLHGMLRQEEGDRVVLLDLCNRMDIYGRDAHKAMTMFYPNSMTKSIVELCS